MSTRRRDPKDAAIEFVMTQPVEAAAMFVSTLASIVKARQNGVQLAAPAKPATQKPASTASRSRTRPADTSKAADQAKPGPRAVTPEELEAATTGSGDGQAQPDKSGDGLPLN